MTPLAVIVFNEKLSSFKWLLINDFALLVENNGRKYIRCIFVCVLKHYQNERAEK